MKRFLLSCCILVLALQCGAQTTITCTDTTVAQVMMGNYNPGTYMASTVISDPGIISSGINSRVSPDSLHAFINILGTFRNRNTGADTISPVTGIGAARKWVLEKFGQFSAQNEHRLLPAYLQFDLDICSIAQHKDILAVLPGTDTTDKSIVIIEGHIDSRCKDVCDTACIAQGMEDNASGTALVLELARVMSKYSYKRTIVFVITIGEEQGLYGAMALATYAQQHGISIHGVLNNDVIGGIICGHTASGPGCPGFDNIDSTNVRLFSYGGFNSLHKGLARFIKLEYQEMVLPIASVPMTLNIMTPEDRIGRGGDHMPFRQLNYAAMRFTSANESGDADVTNPGYIDRQHTSADSIGVDINGDGLTDTFFVDFDYLARNAVINGNAASMMGIGPLTPDYTASAGAGGTIIINITTHPEYLNYRVGIRSTTYDWDSVYTFTGSLADTIAVPDGNHIVSVASVDAHGTESLFSHEATVNTHGAGVANVTYTQPAIELLQNRPNPTDEATMISVQVNERLLYKDAYISIRDMAGRELRRLPISLNIGMNEVMYTHGYHTAGVYNYTLVVDGVPLQSKRMVFTN